MMKMDRKASKDVYADGRNIAVMSESERSNHLIDELEKSMKNANFDGEMIKNIGSIVNSEMSEKAEDIADILKTTQASRFARTLFLARALDCIADEDAIIDFSR